MFVDASAFCAILLGEPERDIFEQRLANSVGATTSAIAIWETVRSLVRAKGMSVAEAELEVLTYAGSAEITIIEIGAQEATMAVSAFARFGKGLHPAKLNMGDCLPMPAPRRTAPPSSTRATISP